MKVVVAVPFHSNKMSVEENAALEQCAKIFGDHREIVFVIPESLDCSNQKQLIPSARIERFDDSFFTSVSGYNRLLLTPEFYQRFADYEFMLIYQPDAWVFRDELDYWCEQGYDYIGAPFIHSQGKIEKIIVGNGGFSLRKISAMLRVLDSPGKKMFPRKLLAEFFRFYISRGKFLHALKPLLRMAGVIPNRRGKYLEQIRHERYNSEDMIFYFLGKQFTDDGLIMPEAKVAADFSLDTCPERFFNKLPFGAHAWVKNNYPFWKKYITVDSNKGLESL